jgi:hypothetical protein
LSQDPFIFLKVLRTPKSGLYPFITMWEIKPEI